MKTLIFLITYLTILLSLKSIKIIDDRDYPEDGYMIILNDDHIGYLYADCDGLDIELF